jgi:hypothetical protein
MRIRSYVMLFCIHTHTDTDTHTHTHTHAQARHAHQVAHTEEAPHLVQRTAHRESVRQRQQRQQQLWPHIHATAAIAGRATAPLTLDPPGTLLFPSAFSLALRLALVTAHRYTAPFPTLAHPGSRRAFISRSHAFRRASSRVHGHFTPARLYGGCTVKTRAARFAPGSPRRRPSSCP